MESPTLRLFPGDRLVIHLHNDLPAWRGYRAPAPHGDPASRDADCAATHLDPSFTNLHFHGLTIPPLCHQDDVIRTAIPAGGEFEYRVTIPPDEPPGLYWYHPHPHGYGERQVQGGASGALIIEGLETALPSLKTLPQRVLVLRDQQRIGPEASTPQVPAWDISANFVPITYSKGQPAILKTKPGEKELWRVLNAGADNIFDLQVLVGNHPQLVQMVAIDGVPITPPKLLPKQTSVLLPPGARAEFIVTTPKSGEEAQLITRAWDTGPQGDNDTRRTIAEIVPSSPATGEGEESNNQRSAIGWSPLRTLPPATVHRRLYFSQLSANPQDPDNFVLYYVTVVGQTPSVYKMGQPPNIVVHRGDVEDWVVENRSPEDHVFHIHQIHFRVLEVDGKPVNDPTMRDTVDVPYWKGEGPYPSAKLRMDFSDPNIVGTFLYHCHILKHEDMGMMGSIQVLPPGTPTRLTVRSERQNVRAGDPVVILATIAPRPASGAIQFVVDGYDVGRPVPLSAGQATFTTSFAEGGSHNISAFYTGNAHYDESSAESLKLRVRD
jgi:FtsP/CotA-like multicopper oxidase with cupredoxin domain